MALPALLPILAVLGRQLAVWLTTSVIIKIIAKTAIVVLLPIVLTKFMLNYSSTLMNYVLGLIDLDIDPVVFSITGTAGWIADKLNVAEIVSLYLSALSINFTLSWFRR